MPSDSKPDPKPEPKPIAEMSFEEAMSSFESIVDRLDRGDVPLEQSIAIYERGVALQRHCDTKLKEAQMRVEKIVTNDSGEASGTEAFDAG